MGNRRFIFSKTCMPAIIVPCLTMGLLAMMYILLRPMVADSVSATSLTLLPASPSAPQAIPQTGVLPTGAMTTLAISDDAPILDDKLYLPVVIEVAAESGTVVIPDPGSGPEAGVVPVQLGAHIASDIRLAYTDTTVLATDLRLVREMGSGWLRMHAPWNELEVSQGVYDWDVMDATFDQVIGAGLKPLPIIWGAPTWAAEEDCGPISDTASFERFLDALISRYSDRVDAWEFTNEPDSKERHDWGPIIGCWGLEPEAYAEQLGIFAARVREYDPDALVVSGGIAHDNWPIFEETFWERTLAAGAGEHFDVANFHYYPINPVDFPTMAHKTDRIKAAMDTHSVTGKQIWITETGMWVNQNGSLEAQKNFIVQEQTRGFAAGVDNIFWFDPKERKVPLNYIERWLINKQQEPINGYSTYQFYASKVTDMISQGRIAGFPEDVEGYHFTSEGRELYIVWSNDGAHTVAILSEIDATVSTRDGDSVTTVFSQNGEILVDVDALPLYIEIIEP